MKNTIGWILLLGIIAGCFWLTHHLNERDRVMRAGELKTKKYKDSLELELLRLQIQETKLRTDSLKRIAQ